MFGLNSRKYWAKTPSDLEILDAIFEKYYDSFASFSEAKADRSTKVYVPIDIASLADDMKVDPDLIFGRLYYHLDNKFAHDKVHFFSVKVGDDLNCVNFPYLASVLADLRKEKSRYSLAMSLSIISVIVSAIALVISVFLGRK